MDRKEILDKIGECANEIILNEASAVVAEDPQEKKSFENSAKYYERKMKKLQNLLEGI